MNPENSSEQLRVDCEKRIERVERNRWLDWLPYRRRQRIYEYYDIGYSARKIAAYDLVEKCFGSAIELMKGGRPNRRMHSLKTFNTIAACHNLLGLQYSENQRESDAIIMFDEAIKLRTELLRLFPDDRENHVYLGGALCNRGYSTIAINTTAAREFFERSIAALRQPNKQSECSYWDESRQTWWCEQLESLSQILYLPWVSLAPQFLDNALQGLRLIDQSKDEGYDSKIR